MTKYIVLGGAATCSEGFVNCFLRVPQALGCTAAAMLPKQARELLDNILQNLPQQVPAPPSISARFGSVTYHFIFWYLQKSLSQAKMTPPAWRYKVQSIPLIVPAVGLPKNWHYSRFGTISDILVN